MHRYTAEWSRDWDAVAVAKLRSAGASGQSWYKYKLNVLNRSTIAENNNAKNKSQNIGILLHFQKYS